MRWQAIGKMTIVLGISIILEVLLFSIFLGTSSLADEKKITAVTEPWLPYMGPKLIDKGFLPQVLEAAFSRVGYSVEVEFKAWEDALNDVKTGKKDILCGAYYAAEREQYLAYSQPIAEAQDVLFMKANKKISYTQLSDLKPYKIGVVSGAVHGKEFDAANFLIKEAVSQRDQNIRKLLVDKIDLMAGPRDVINYIVKRDFPLFVDKIVVVDPPLSTNKIYFCFSKKVDGYQNLLAAFSEGLAQIKNDGTYESLAQKHGIKVIR